MTSSTTTASGRRRDEVLADAIRVLTEAVRLRRPDPTGSSRWPADWADFLAEAITAAAANAGDLATALEGRPGSWEADLVRQLVAGTAGEDPADLARYRTEPVRVTLRPADMLVDLGYETLYDESQRIIDELRRPHQWRYRREATDEWVARDEGAPPPTFPDPAGPAYQSTVIMTVPRSEADEAPLAQLAQIESDLEDLRYGADADEYGAALRLVAAQVATELLPDIDVNIDVALELSVPDGGGHHWNELAEQILETTLQRTRLPWSGLTPAEYPPGQSIADTERQAGRLPHVRTPSWPGPLSDDYAPPPAQS